MMRKKLTAIEILCVFLFSTIITVTHGDARLIDIVYVDNDYYEGGINDGHQWGYDAFHTIRDGVENVSEYGTIYVQDGTYSEDVTINKPLSLIGENKETTTIESVFDTIHIYTNGVTICGFTLKPHDSSIGISLESAGNNISNNIFILEGGRGRGIRIQGDQNLVRGNLFLNGEYGVDVGGDSNELLENTFQGNTIGVSVPSMSSNNIIYHNNFIGDYCSALDSSGAINYWYLSFPGGGGNYWNDFAGGSWGIHDDFKGENQDVFGPDAIIDNGTNAGGGINPYDVTGGGRDVYPYICENGWITHHAPLELLAPSPVSEDTLFQITVAAEGNPLENVQVTFDHIVLTTNENGQVTFLAPTVEQTTQYTLIAEKTGYITDSTSIVVTDVHPPSPEPSLTITAPTTIDEHHSFVVTVTAEAEPVEGVTLTFNGESYETDLIGQVLLYAPGVDDTVQFIIIAGKQGYQSDTTVITVLPLEGNISISLVAPNGNESWSGNRTITWTIGSTDEPVRYALTILYQYASGLWISVVENREDIRTPYYWDTRTLPDGYPYIVKVLLNEDRNYDGVYETLVAQDMSDAAFAIDNSVIHQGWVQGTVGERVQNEIKPLQNVTVYVVLSTLNNIITSKCTLTNEAGQYRLPVRAGVYSVIATKTGYSTTSIDNVSVWANETTSRDFSLEPGFTETNLFLFTENRDLINNAIRNQQVGGEIMIVKKEGIAQYENWVFLYNAMTIEPMDIAGEKITIRVGGDEKSRGKTILVTLDDSFISPAQEITILYDGESLRKADTLMDILNPDDDGFHAEYFIINDDEAALLAISIPHFSIHDISITLVKTIIKELGGPVEIVLYAVSSIIIVSVFLYPVYRRTFPFRRDDEK